MSVTWNKKNFYARGIVQRHKDRRVKYFTIHQYETREKAEAAADKWVREQLREMPEKMSSKNRMTHRNSSGHVGVHLHPQVIRKPSGEEYEYFSWISKWPGCPLRGGVKWATKTLGYDDAYVLAVLCRRMETINRRQVFEAFERIKGKAEYNAISKLRGDAA
jgi:hypothetical protein